MKGEKSRISPAKKIVSTLTEEEKEEREREAVKERERYGRRWFESAKKGGDHARDSDARRLTVRLTVADSGLPDVGPGPHLPLRAGGSRSAASRSAASFASRRPFSRAVFLSRARA